MRNSVIAERSRKDAIAMKTTSKTTLIPTQGFMLALGLSVVIVFLMGNQGTYAQGAGSATATTEANVVNFDVSESVQRLDMIVKSSRILRLQGRIPKFQVHNEEVLTATPVSENQIQVFAKVPGTTQLNLWDNNEKLYTVDVTITADAREVEGILASQLPQAMLRVTPLDDSAILSGTVTSADDVDRAVAIVEQFYARVINNIQVVGVQQVLLHTKIMEVSRTKLRDLGIDWSMTGSGSLVANAPSGLLSFNPAVPPSDLTTVGIVAGDFDSLIRALRQDDLVKLLAEPTVVATHGRPARFNVGGRVPFIVPSGNGAVSITYEEFGTSVDFLPFVVGPGRIRLEVRPEVTEPDASRGINANGISVTGFTTRYVETAVEMQAGQTFAIAGLLQSRTESTVSRTPFFGELPYVGALFRRVRERRNDIELMITVTPEFVEAMEPHEVPCGGPGLSTTSPTDKELYWKGYIEVPNLYGDCGTAGGAECGMLTSDVSTQSMPVQMSGSPQPVAPQQQSLGMPSQAMSPAPAMQAPAITAPAMPNNATAQPKPEQVPAPTGTDQNTIFNTPIVPGPTPVRVGQGVTIEAPVR